MFRRLSTNRRGSWASQAISSPPAKRQPYSNCPDHPSFDLHTILLDHPAGWSTGALGELRGKLAGLPEGFTEDRLRQAYHHALADIISLVKHAGEGDPLLIAQERVDRALARVTAGKAQSRGG